MQVADLTRFVNNKYAYLRIEYVFTMVADIAHMLGIDYISAVQSAYDTIKDRKGKLVNGVFIKEDE